VELTNPASARLVFARGVFPRRWVARSGTGAWRDGARWRHAKEGAASMPTLLDPGSDYVFKCLFMDTPVLLADLIGAVPHDEPPLRHVHGT